jgi:hypothetical protein
MADMAFQDVFNRVYLYLIAAGTDMTGERFRALLQLIDDAMTKASREGGAVSVLETAMDMVPERFALPPKKILNVQPPLKRGSIGYRPLPASSAAAS